MINKFVKDVDTGKTLEGRIIVAYRHYCDGCGERLDDLGRTNHNIICDLCLEKLKESHSFPDNE